MYTGAGDLGDRGEILAWPSGVMVSANFIITSTREAISSGAASFIEPESSAYEGSERGWEFGGIGLREFGSGVWGLGDPGGPPWPKPIYALRGILTYMPA